MVICCHIEVRDGVKNIGKHCLETRSYLAAWRV
jgi:hypothetical protein